MTWHVTRNLDFTFYTLQTQKAIKANSKDERYAQRSLVRELPLLVTHGVKLVDPEDNLPTDIEWKFTEEGEEVRVSKRTGRTIGFPMEYNFFTEGDNININTYRPSETKDTSEEELKKITFTPTLATFEEDLMKKYGNKEKRKPGKTYWY